MSEPGKWVATDHDPRCIGLPGNSTEPEFTERLCDCRTLAMLDGFTEEGRARDRAALGQALAELAEYPPILNRLGELLDGVALALRGPPPPLTSWGYHDLPERAAAEVAARLAALAEAAEHGEALARVRHILSSGYGCLRCAEADLRAAVGLDPSTEPHEHP